MLGVRRAALGVRRAALGARRAALGALLSLCLYAPPTDIVLEVARTVAAAAADLVRLWIKPTVPEEDVGVVERTEGVVTPVLVRVEVVTAVPARIVVANRAHDLIHAVLCVFTFARQCT